MGIFDNERNNVWKAFEEEWPLGKLFCYGATMMRVCGHHSFLHEHMEVCGVKCHYIDKNGVIRELFLIRAVMDSLTEKEKLV